MDQWIGQNSTPKRRGYDHKWSQRNRLRARRIGGGELDARAVDPCAYSTGFEHEKLQGGTAEHKKDHRSW